MAKIALLIGVSESKGLDTLLGTQADIQAMARVLKSPEIGGFDVVDILPNPDPIQMQIAIEKLFSENRSREDLILLYFSGHGVLDDEFKLHFATCITEKNSQGRILTSTAVSARALHEYMGRSRSKRQVVILDCCYSGAFAKDMKAKGEEQIDIKAQLGAEGRAILTSSTAAQLSYEKDGASIYTRYLVQGLETGAADRDNDGKISVDELHEYAKEKVQESAPTMQPEIYPVKEGYRIFVARAPQGDPKLTYRKELDDRAKRKRGKLSRIDQRALKFRWQELGLSEQEAETIEREVLQPYEIFWQKLDEFEQALKELLEEDPTLSPNSVDDLQYLQRVLKLRDEDITETLTKYGVQLIDSEAIPSVPAKTPVVFSAVEQDDLRSEKGIDYTKLRDLLKAQDWKAADQETYEVMIRAVGKKSGQWFTSEELLNFPCADLKTIDTLWVKHSNGHFGFSVQKQIYVECGAKLDGEYPGDKIWRKFGSVVGWRKNDSWLSYEELFENPPLSSEKGKFPFSVEKGKFPLIRWGEWVWVDLFSRTETCEL